VVEVHGGILSVSDPLVAPTRHHAAASLMLLVQGASRWTAARAKLRVQVGPDHTLKLPSDVPVGPTEVIVLVDDRPKEGRATSLLGLFANEPVHQRRGS